MRGIALVPWLVDAGAIAATLSSALASFLGAPRILQSLAADRLFPFLKPFAVGHGATNNPRRGVLLAAGIALVTVAVGDLNLIAPVVSMFFLISYGLLNFATFAESRSNSPSFRPRFRFFDARLSLVGALGCLGAMIALDPLAATISLALLAAVYVYLERSVTVQRWADSSRSVQFQRLRDSLVKLSTKLAHPRDWRPVILAFSDDAARRARLIRFAEWIEGDAGITTVVKILHGTGVRTRLQREEAERTLRKEIAELEVKAFPRAIAAADFETAVSVLLEAHGLGPVRPNTVTLNWYDPGVCAKEEGEEKQADRRSYGKNLRAALSHGCHVVVLHTTTEQFERLLACPPDERGIDVFYTNDDTGRLMLLLAYLMTRTRAWETATIRLVVERSDDEATRPKALRTMLEEARIDAQLAIVDRIDAVTVRDACSCASLVFLPMRLREGVPVSAYEASPDELADALPPTAFCLAAQVIELDAPPESGIHQRIADAQDAAEVAAKRAGKSETDEVATQQAVAALEARLEQQRAEGAEPDAVEATEKELATAREAHATANRRAARDKAKSEGADREADAAADE